MLGVVFDIQTNFTKIRFLRGTIFFELRQLIGFINSKHDSNCNFYFLMKSA